MLECNFADPNFPTKHLLKDVTLVISGAQKVNLNIDALQGTSTLIEKALKMGLANEDYSSIYSAVNPPK